MINKSLKYCVVIIDGAAGWPLPEHSGRTCLDLARTPNLDAMAREGILGLARTVPEGMEPSSACACMSVLGYNPKIYYQGRSPIEAKSMGVPVEEGDVVFRCNLVTIRDGKMLSYNSGHISTEEARPLVQALSDELGDEGVSFYPGTNYRHLCRITGREDTLLAECTAPHDIPDKQIAEFLPRGQGGEILRDLMSRSEAVLKVHTVNKQRESKGELPATMIWLFWGSKRVPDMPSFNTTYGMDAAVTSGVDLLRGLAGMLGMEILDIKGVTDGPDNDYAAQAIGAMEALERHNLVVIHIEAPDEAGHAGSIDGKIEAIEKVDSEVVGRFRTGLPGRLRMLIMPDHPTPIKIQTHTDGSVPFLLWGPGFESSNARVFTEAEAERTGVTFSEAYRIMDKLLGR